MIQDGLVLFGQTYYITLQPVMLTAERLRSESFEPRLVV